MHQAKNEPSPPAGKGDTASRRTFVMSAAGAVGVALAGAGVGRRAGAAGQPTAPTSEELARGFMPYADLIGGPAEVITVRTTLPPGTALPWHTHPGPLFFSVTAGTLTIARDEFGCQLRIEAGMAFMFAAGETHTDSNEGPEPTEFLGTYVIPAGSPLRVPAEPPSGPVCP